MIWYRQGTLMPSGREGNHRSSIVQTSVVYPPTGSWPEEQRPHHHSSRRTTHFPFLLLLSGQQVKSSSLLAESLQVLAAGSAANASRCPGVTAPCDWSTRRQAVVSLLAVYTDIVVTRLTRAARTGLLSHSPHWTFTPRTLPQTLTCRQRRANLQQAV